MPGHQERFDQAEQNPNEWQVKMIESPCKEPIQCLGGCICPCCTVYYHREKLLEHEQAEYHCCHGYIPLCGLGEMDCPKVPCLCLESFCCLGCAVSVNRAIIQDNFQIKTDPCDSCIICCTNIMLLVRCIAGCFMDIPDEIDHCIDCIYYSVVGCMNAQHGAEMDHQGVGKTPG